MILFKNNKTNKQKTEMEHGQEEQIWGSQGKWGGSARDGHFGGLGDTNCYTWNGWAMGPIVQHREMCVIGPLCCTTELDKTL